MFQPDVVILDLAMPVMDQIPPYLIHAEKLEWKNWEKGLYCAII